MRLLIGFLLALSLAGCSQDLKSRLVGRWVADLQTIQAGPATAELKQRTEIAGATLDLNDDGTFRSTDGSRVTTGTWSIEGQHVTLAPSSGDTALTPTIQIDSKGKELTLTVTEGGQTATVALKKR